MPQCDMLRALFKNKPQIKNQLYNLQTNVRKDKPMKTQTKPEVKKQISIAG